MLVVWVLVVIGVIVAIAVVLYWYTWRTFGSFRLEDLTRDRVESDSLDALIEAQAEFEAGVDKLTRELDLMKADRRWQ